MYMERFGYHLYHFLMWSKKDPNIFRIDLVPWWESWCTRTAGTASRRSFVTKGCWGCIEALGPSWWASVQRRPSSLRYILHNTVWWYREKKMVVANIFVVVEVTFIPSSLFVFFAIKVLIKKNISPKSLHVGFHQITSTEIISFQC